MGLTDEEALINRRKYGSNILTKSKRSTFLNLLLESLGDPIIKILLLALLGKVIFLFKSFDWFETIGILVAVLLATLISSLSEYGSEAAFSKLQDDNEKILVKVLRDNILKEISIDDVVVSDIIILSSGDKVPADGYICEGYLSLDESSLNGETKESKKVSVSNVDSVTDVNLVYRGSVCYSGSAKMKVLKVGDNTLYGSINSELQEKTNDSPLKIRLRGLAKIVSMLGYIGAFLVTISYLYINIVVNNNYNLSLIMNTLTNFNLMADYLIYALTLSVTIIVVAVPEGLPMMITLVLSSNMKKMLKEKVLVRKMVGIETAGSLNILLTDKTGTLTKGVLEVTELSIGDAFKFNRMKDLKRYKDIYNLVSLSLFYNNESILSDGKVIGGNSTDKSLLNFCKNDYIDAKVLSKNNFNSDKKYSEARVVYNGKEINLIKGAPDILLKRCNKKINIHGKKEDFKDKRYVNKILSNYTKKGSRVILLACQNKDEFIYIGLVSIKDEIRDEAIMGVNLIKKAGINIIMITGDSKETARVIAKDVGLINSYENIVMDSTEFNKLSDDDIMKKIDNIRVVARALPTDKSRLVRICQDMNIVVGMTGDGVNDAPALKKADVGFAMGSGTEVSKEASDIVILDNNILSIRKAILYGITIFNNIRKFIIYQLSINICALIISIVGTTIGISEPITIIQMLWLNMIMDTFAGIAFSFEPALTEYMYEKSKSKDEAIMNKYMLTQIITSGLYSSIICLLFLKLPIVRTIFRTGPNNIYLYTSYFALFIFLGVFNSFNSRTHRINILANITRNKIFILVFGFISFVQIYIIYFGGSLFRTYGLTLRELLMVLIIASSTLIVDFSRKIYLKKQGITKGV